MHIYPLSRIHNTSLVSAYFGLQKRECGCLEQWWANFFNGGPQSLRNSRGGREL
jgi:hypothetical protein